MRSIIEESQEWQRYDQSGILTTVQSRYFSRIKVNPVLKRRSIFVIAQAISVITATDQWHIYGRLDLFFERVLIGSVKVRRGNFVNIPTPPTSDPSNDIEMMNEETSNGSWPTMVIDIDSSSSAPTHSIKVPCFDMLAQIDEVGLYVDRLVTGGVSNVGFALGLRVISRI